MAIVFGRQACLVQTIENPELWEPATLGESASHIRGRIVVAKDTFALNHMYNYF